MIKRIFCYPSASMMSQTEGMVRIKPLTIEFITKTVCDFYNTDINKIVKGGKSTELLISRQTAVYLCKTLTRNSMKTIGKFFNRDHSTITYTMKTVRDLMATEPNYLQNVRSIEYIISQAEYRNLQ